VDPVGVTIKILHRVKRGSQRDQYQNFADAVIALQFAVAGQQLLCIRQQLIEEVIKI